MDQWVVLARLSTIATITRLMENRIDAMSWTSTPRAAHAMELTLPTSEASWYSVSIAAVLPAPFAPPLHGLREESMKSNQRPDRTTIAFTFTGVSLAATLLAGASFANVASADEGFFSRINPWRKSAAAAPTAPASAATTSAAPATVAPSSFGQGFSLPKLGQLFSSSTTSDTPNPAPPTYDSAAIEARLSQMTAAGAKKLDQTLPSVEQYRTQMQAQGYDTAAIEAGVAQLAAAGAQNVQQRLPSVDEVRAKMQAQGYDTATIETRVAQLVAAGQVASQAYQTYQTFGQTSATGAAGAAPLPVTTAPALPSQPAVPASDPSPIGQMMKWWSRK